MACCPSVGVVAKAALVLAAVWTLLGMLGATGVLSVSPRVSEWVDDAVESAKTEWRIHFLDPEESKALLLEHCMHLEYVANDEDLHSRCYEWTRAAYPAGEETKARDDAPHDAPPGYTTRRTAHLAATLVGAAAGLSVPVGTLVWRAPQAQ